MNQTTFGLIFLLLAFSTSLKLMMFGDIGQIAYYKDGTPAIANDIITDSYCPLSFDMTLGLVNFRRVFCQASNLLSTSDIISIAGDIVYPETAANKVSATIPPSPNTNDGKVIMITKLFPNSNAWANRVKCGFQALRALLTNYQGWCGKPTPSILAQKSNNNFVALQLIEGNHSFDVDINVESQEILNLANNYALPIAENINITASGQSFNSYYSKNARNMSLSDFILYPRITQNIDSNGVRVQFLDYNSMIMTCGFNQNEASYNACVSSFNYLLFYQAYFNYTSAARYVERFIVALQNLDVTADWRIMRAHHPIYNLEGDTLGYFNQNFSYNGKSYGNVFDIIKAAGIHFSLASHIHLAYVMATPYYNNVLKTGNFVASTANTINSGCYDNSNYFLGNNVSNTPITSCSYQGNYTININGLNPEYFWEVIVGNSGRVFNSLTTDGITRGTMIWGRSLSIYSGIQSYGGYQINFSKNSCNVQYFETSPNSASLSRLNSSSDISQFSFNSPFTFNFVKNSQFNSYSNINSNFLQKLVNYTTPLDNLFSPLRSASSLTLVYNTICLLSFIAFILF